VTVDIPQNIWSPYFVNILYEYFTCAEKVSSFCMFIIPCFLSN